MRRFLLSLLVGLAFSLTTFAQSISFEVVSDIDVKDINGKSLDLSVVGGLNQPQMYNLDIDNDGKMDLFIFDRTGAKTISLINDGTGKFTYHPEFDHIYPGRFTTWVVFKDYNNDNLPDLWFYSEDDDAIELWRNVTVASDKHAKFEMADGNLRAYNFNDAPLDTNDLYCDRTNIPAIEDVDGDGDVDFLTLQTLGYGITLFLNNTVERGEPLDPPQFEIADECWGDFQEFDGINRIDFNRDKFCFHKYYRHFKKKHAGGSSLLLLDNDEDGDMDLVLGNAGLNNLNLLENGKNDNGMKIDTMISSDSLFPSNSKRAEMKSFPASYYQDVDGDGIRDLLVAVNMFDKRSYNYRETENIFYYKNKGKDNNPDFVIEDTAFLSNQMVDHGGYTVPVLWDMDGDDDLDLILATNGDWGITYDTADYLVYYENTGTKTNPRFEAKTYDYLGLKKYHIQDLYPALGDLNRDGNPELLIGQLNGTLSLFNIVGSGKSATASKVGDNSYGVQVFESSAPHLADVDGDGYIDLLVGSYDGNTEYHRNTSKTTSPSFKHMTDTFGGVLPGYWRTELQFDPKTQTFYDSTVYQRVAYSSPTLMDLDKNGDPEFIVGDIGKITIYRNTRRSGNDSFQQVEQNPFFLSGTNECYDYNFGAQPSVAVGDLNGDGRVDMVVGDNRGGFQIAFAAGKCNLGVSDDVNSGDIEPLALYPNPTTGIIHFSGTLENEAQLMVYDLGGQLIYNQLINPNLEIDLSALRNGIYTVQLISSKETRVGKMIKLSE